MSCGNNLPKSYLLSAYDYKDGRWKYWRVSPALYRRLVNIARLHEPR